MASLREIKTRIGSVRSTLKITSAMKLVASAKLHKAQSAIENMLPYQRTLQEIVGCTGGASLETAELRDDARTAVVALSSNSSLCGGFNANAIRKTLSVLSETERPEIYAVGHKMSDALKAAGYDVGRDFSDLVARPSYASAAALADLLVEKYVSGAIDKVILVYNHFVSTSHQEAVSEVFLPFATSSQADGDGYLFEPSREEIAREVLPQMLQVKMYTVILDSVASEHAARTVAMQTASDNAEDLLSELTLEYNKRRQEKITSELLDIVGGSQ